MPVLERGAFLLSIDTELGDAAISSRSAHVVTCLLELMVKYHVRATWAVMGSSLDPGPRDVLSSQYRQVMREIMEQNGTQELGCHTFSHVRAGDPACSRARFEAELEACRAVAQQSGISFRSFIYPYNSIGHLGSLGKFGLTAYRGRAPVWYEGLPTPVRRICNLLDHWFFIPPPTVQASYQHGVWNLPASYFYVCGSGWGRMIPVWLRINKAREGLRRAAEKKRLFHMWFHPFNLVNDTGMWLKGLESIFAEVERYRDLGRLDNPTMGELASRLQGTIQAKTGGVPVHGPSR